MMKKSNRWLSFFTKPILMTIIIALSAIIGLFCVNTFCSGNFYAESIIAPIDIKKQVSGIQDMIIDTFTSNSFLEKLPDERLQDIRSNAITEMHKQRYPNMQKGLMDKDKEIFYALMHPYYEVYRETAIYYKNKNFNWDTFSDENGTKVLYRTVNIQYTIKSPTMDSVEDTADLSIRKCVQTPIESNNEQIIKKIFNLSHFYISVDEDDRYDIKDAIICSVVPNVMHSLASAMIKYLDIKPIIVGADLKTGLRIAVPNPQQVGADRIVDAVAAYEIYGGPILVMDFGTATTYDLVDESGAFIGGITAPGIRTAGKALWEDAAKLPEIEIVKPEKIVGVDE